MNKLFEFPLKMHVGVPCEAVVKINDEVKRGQCIAEPKMGLGAKIHSSVNGIVKNITKDEIIIKADEIQDSDYVKIKKSNSIADTVYEAGIVGAGGAGFPTYIKLKSNIPNGFIIANCIECEPLLNHNITLIEKNPEIIIKGIKYAMEATKAKKAYIGIKAKNKKAIKALENSLKDEENIEIKEFQDIYPMGEERALIHGILGTWLEPDELPIKANSVVLNGETLANIAYAIDYCKPFIDKDISVSGKLKSGKDTKVFLKVPIGMKISDLIEKAGGIDGDYGEIIIGGPYTGKSYNLEDSIVTKTSGGAIVTMEIPKFKGNLGLLVCACGANEDRLRDLASKMESNVVKVLECKNVNHIKNSLKCKTPGHCPGQAALVLQFKKAGAERILISNCCDCTNTVMNCAPKLGLPVYHHTDHVFRTVNHKLTRRLE